MYIYKETKLFFFFFAWGGKKGQGRKTVAKALASTKLAFKIKRVCICALLIKLGV